MPDWLATIDNEIVIHLTPNILTQIERESLLSDGIIYKLNSQDLLQVLGSSLGFGSKGRGAIVILTYYDQVLTDTTNLTESLPILRTLMNVSGSLSQKVSEDILNHPDAERILWVHSFLIGQITQQFTRVIEDYIEAKFRPFLIAGITTTTLLTWREPIESNISNFFIVAIAVIVLVLLIWWVTSKIPSRFSSSLKLQYMGKKILHFLDSIIMKIFAVVAIAFLIIGWLLVKFEFTNPIDARLMQTIQIIQSETKFYLPIALVSLRKLIFSLLGKIFQRFPFILKFFFGRFVQ